MEKQRILFANVLYEKSGTNNGFSKHANSGGLFGELYNFNSVPKDGKSVCLGFFEPGHYTDKQQVKRSRQVHIENIDPVFAKAQETTGVLVIWHAVVPNGDTSIIGWYKNATVYREYTPRTANLSPSGRDEGFTYNVVADKSNCVRLPESEIRNNRAKWSGCREKINGFGFGQSNMWYANEQSAEVLNYVSKLVDEINNYKGQNDVT
ncbi:hypothetical protein FACS1894211_13040 [Clostridia bacterium]|nr:hypothetical protein FACS1894211_13040 [Clostridia bacterium]